MKTDNKNKRKSRNGKNDKRSVPMILLSASIVAVIALITAVIILTVNGLHSETYKMVSKAIKNTEALEDFTIQISSSTLMTGGGISQQTDTEGYIYTLDNMDFVYVYANTSSDTSDESVKDFDVTASMYSDGKHVYDNSTGKDEIIEDFTCEEFDEIVSQYELYKYKEPDATNVAFNESDIKGQEGEGDLIVTLSKPNDSVLNALAEGMSTATGEKVTKNDLKVISASVTYSIYDDLIAGQTCNFSVSYTRSDGEVIQYSTATHILYMEETSDEIESLIGKEEDAK